MDHGGCLCNIPILIHLTHKIFEFPPPVMTRSIECAFVNSIYSSKVKYLSIHSMFNYLLEDNLTCQEIQPPFLAAFMIYSNALWAAVGQRLRFLCTAIYLQLHAQLATPTPVSLLTVFMRPRPCQCCPGQLDSWCCKFVK